MIRYVPVLFFLLFLASCEERVEEKPKFNPVGVWENTTHWDNNHITLTVRPDSVMLFKVEKNFCPGTKFFVSVGEWHIEKDSLLIMEQFTDTSVHFELRELFPELVQTQKDSHNVITLGVSARLIMADSSLYDVDKNGKAARERSYRKTGELK